MMARETGFLTGSLGIGAGTDGTLGQVFELQVSDDLSAVTFWSQAPVLNDTFSVSIYQFGIAPGNLIATSATQTITTSTPGWFTTTFASPLNLAAGKYLIAVNESFDQSIAIGTSTEYFKPGTNWYKYGTVPWSKAEDVGFLVQYMLRPILSTVPTLDEPFLLSPSNAAVNVDSNMVMLDWSDVNGATGYYYEVSNDANFGTIINSGNTVVSEIAMNGMTGSTQYFWKVQATAGAAISFFSTPFSFTTQGPPNAVVEAQKQSIKLYPNPTSGLVYFTGTTEANIEVFSLLGERVKTVQIMKSQNTIDCSDLPVGNYLLKINSNNSTELKKLVVIR